MKHQTAATADEPLRLLMNICNLADGLSYLQVTVTVLPPRSLEMDEQPPPLPLSVPPATLVLKVLWSQQPWLLQLVAFTRVSVAVPLPETLKKPRPQLVALS